MSLINISATVLLSLSLTGANAAPEPTKKHEKLEKHSEKQKTHTSEKTNLHQPKAQQQKVKGKTVSNPKVAKHSLPTPQQPHKLKSTASSNILMTKQDIANAVAAPDKGQGKIIPYFGFYKTSDIHTIMDAGSGNGFWYLSNYFVSSTAFPVAVKINYKGKVYTFNATETAYQAGKCLISGVVTKDADIQKFVKATPNQAKGLANHQFQCGTLSGSDMLDLMHNIVSQKFAGPLGVKMRTETGLTTLIEGNSWGDSYWGRTFNGVQHAPGQSHLGDILMDVRANGGNPGPFVIK